ncbi:MAG: universal stress protein [Chloroflexota bacterium]|nr:universal stress protein [Chloroflexota bacterium]
MSFWISGSPNLYEREASPFHSILVPTDGSAASVDAGRLAISMAATHGIPVTFLYVVNRCTAEDIASASPHKDVDSVCEELRSKARNYLDYLSRLARRAKVECHQITRAGNPHREIAKCARENEVDLIVIGQTSAPGITRPGRIGEVAGRVIEYAPCPVLIVKHSEERY